MALFRDDPEFAAGITEAASRLGVARSFVEKDYCVTQVLRALHLVFPGQFLLKGDGAEVVRGDARHVLNDERDIQSRRTMAVDEHSDPCRFCRASEQQRHVLWA